MDKKTTHALAFWKAGSVLWEKSELECFTFAVYDDDGRLYGLRWCYQFGSFMLPKTADNFAINLSDSENQASREKVIRHYMHSTSNHSQQLITFLSLSNRARRRLGRPMEIQPSSSQLS